MMRRRLWSWLVFAPAWLSCNGTSTGNPMTPPDAGQVPDGATLLKSQIAHEVAPELDSADSATLAQSNQAFAFDLYRELGDSEKNQFISPFSISVALAMTYAGARTQTHSEMQSALHFDLPEPLLHSAFNRTLRVLDGRGTELSQDSEGTGFTLRIVNQAWGQNGYPFLDGYLDVLARHYGAGLFSVDFANSEVTRQLINGWVEDQTETRIKDLLPSGSLNSDTRLVLTNAIYFKANWLNQFEVGATLDEVFHAPKVDRTVSMMHQTLDTGYTEGADYQALELPYLSPSVRMLLVLPAEGAFDNVLAGFDAAFFQSVRSSISEHQTDVSLPKFQFETKSSLKGALSALGMPSAFGAADFTGIARGVEHLYIDDVYHNAFVAMDEEGTEAAAATAVVIGTESAKPLAEIRFDRPFIFAIYDEPTGQILFIGHLSDPG